MQVDEDRLQTFAALEIRSGNWRAPRNHADLNFVDLRSTLSDSSFVSNTIGKTASHYAENGLVMAVLVTNDFPPLHGGIQRYMSRLAQELTLRNERVFVVAPQKPNSRLYDRQQSFSTVRYPTFGRILSFVAMTLYLLRTCILERQSYTIASVWFPGGLAACLLPRFLRGRLGVLAHGTEIAPDRGGLRRAVMRYVFSHSDVVIANSRFTRDLLRRAGIEDNVAIVYVGIDDKPMVPAPTAQPTVLSVGRLVERKGFDRVIEALPAVVERFPSVIYEIVGDGPQRLELERLVERYRVKDHVKFLGPVDDEQMRAAYARAWCFALPVRVCGSDVEGFGIVYLEAAMASLPALGGRGSGAEDAIVHGETGLLIDGGSTAAVTQAIIALLGDPHRSAEMGRRGRQRALDQFTWRNTAAEVAQLMAPDNKHSKELNAP